MRIFYVVFIILLSSGIAHAQGFGSMLSPGDLAAPHKKLEGLKNCTKCHTIMGGIGDKNCISCHKKLAARIKAEKGFHAGLKKKCIECHSDHKGRSYRMAQFVTEKFDHKRIGYELSGKHRIKCVKCHKSSGTYLGLRRDCLSCHKDTHGKGLSRECLSCHTFKGWAPSLFEHNRDSEYRLAGKHISTECKKCHPKNSYRIENYKKCVTCHRKDDRHKGALGKGCARCHTENGWKKILFNHAGTTWPLKGKHRKTPCEKCHANGKLKIREFRSCDSAGCHRNIHKEQFSPRPCRDCHTVEGWKPSLFNHRGKEYKGYKLFGAHEKVECVKCHKDGVYRPIEYESCSSSLCHSDPHKSQFSGQSCNSCHDERSWKPSSFTHNGPSYKGYKLLGPHEKAECVKCHKAGVYRPIEYESCSSSLCHSDPHKSQFPGQSCNSCHDERSWKPSSFTHNGPLYKGYKLLGAHEKAECVKCHKAGVYRPIEYESCSSLLCHSDPHKSQFPGQSCNSCHDERSWKPSSFTHNGPLYKGYKLLGAHEKAECVKCHKDGVYKPIESDRCASSLCHSDPHKSQFSGQLCKTCHDERSWKPSSFSHKSPLYKGYKLLGAHEKVECEKCHRGGVYKPVEYGKCNSSGCHKDVHDGEFSKQCVSCHIEKGWSSLKFDHNWESSYPLTGKHLKTGCAKCHKGKRYRIEKKECVSCHTDKHKGRFDGTCDSCHTTYNWKPKAGYHEKSGFPLKGVHKQLECTECHENGSGYRNTGYRCYSCHRDPHFNQFGNSCDSCHTESEWFPFRFSHNETGLPLRGVHRILECEECHKNRVYRNITDPQNCYGCHAGKYSKTGTHLSNGYSTECLTCHESFVSWFFKHRLTLTCSDCHLPLYNSAPDHLAKSYSTECTGCHRSTVVWSFSHGSVIENCADCHLALKPGNHVSNGWSSVCEECHNSTTSWQAAHPKTSFPLNHRGTSRDDCEACHPGGNFRNSGGCIECHRRSGADVHSTNVNSGCLECHPSGRE